MTDEQEAKVNIKLSILASVCMAPGKRTSAELLDAVKVLTDYVAMDLDQELSSKGATLNTVNQMIIGIVVLCGLGPLETNTVEGCKPFARLFPTEVTCAQASNIILATKFREGVYVGHTDCRNLGEGAQ